MRLMINDCELMEEVLLSEIVDKECYLKLFSRFYNMQLHLQKILPSYKLSPSINLLCPLKTFSKVQKTAKLLRMSNADRDDALLTVQHLSVIEELESAKNLEDQLKRICFRLQKTIPNVKQRLLYTLVVYKCM